MRVILALLLIAACLTGITLGRPRRRNHRSKHDDCCPWLDELESSGDSVNLDDSWLVRQRSTRRPVRTVSPVTWPTIDMFWSTWNTTKMTTVKSTIKRRTRRRRRRTERPRHDDYWTTPSYPSYTPVLPEYTTQTTTTTTTEEPTEETTTTTERSTTEEPTLCPE